MVINFPASNFFDNVNQVGIVLTSNRTATANHIGILHKFGDEQACILHFTAMHVNGSDPCKNRYIWLDLGGDFTDVDRAIFGAHVKKVIDANNGERVGYGFDKPGGYLNRETGKVMPALGQIGFTCSTFVLEVFEMCGFKLINLDSWPKASPKDRKWQQESIDRFLVVPKDLDQDAIDRQKRNIGGKRYLPEEVAAATQVKIPANRGALLAPAKKIRKHLKAHAHVHRI